MPDEQDKRIRGSALKSESLIELTSKVNKMLGENTLIRGSEIARQTWPRQTTGALAFDVMLGGGWPLNQWNEIIGMECLCPGTKILCADLVWRNIESLAVGEEIVGFDEDLRGMGQGSASRFRRATVTGLGRKVLPVYEITTRYGKTRASAGHGWVVHRNTPRGDGKRSVQRQWVRTEDLHVNNVIAAIGPPWETESSWEAGWLAGFYDGEGCVSPIHSSGTASNARVSVNQVIGQTADYAELLLNKFGFAPQKIFSKRNKPHWQDQWAFKLNGRYEDMRFLGSIRPQRLMSKAHLLWEDVSTKSVHGSHAKVLDIKYLGEQEVVTIETSTKTLVADGLLSHNSAGKTVLALKTIAANMALDPEYECLWIASEDFVPDWAAKLGVDLSRVHLAATNIMEDAYQIAYEALDGQVCDAIVIDSLPALLPGEEAEKAMEEFSMGLGARLTAKFMRKTHYAQKRSLALPERDCLALLINQWRDKIGISYGDPRTTPGGKAKNFSMFTRVEVARDVWLALEDKDKTRVGLGIKTRTIKNKTAPAQRTANVDFYFDDCPPFRAGDYDTIKQVFNLAVANEIILVRGRTYSYVKSDGTVETLGTAKATAQQAVREDLDLQTQIAAEVFALA